MNVLKEIFRLLVILLVSPAIGYGGLIFLEEVKIVTPQYVDKDVFVLLCFGTSMATAIGLFRVWPSTLTPKSNTRTSGFAASTHDSAAENN